MLKCLKLGAYAGLLDTDKSALHHCKLERKEVFTPQLGLPLRMCVHTRAHTQVRVNALQRSIAGKAVSLHWHRRLGGVGNNTRTQAPVSMTSCLRGHSTIPIHTCADSTVAAAA
mmetsp:Transcript_25721/g.69798  ORF Transcript_25721/g.69798 Transcript_25721/m.69798 type:complete len:114 (-) Transcript_25721:1060-1401(-)